MPAQKKSGAIHDAGLVIKESLRTAHSHPQIFIYPYVALIFISVTYSLISFTVLPSWYGRIFQTTDYIAPHKVTAIFGIVGFSAFYTALVTAYFSCAVSASVSAMLENRSVSTFYGLRQVGRNFLRVTRFAILSVFFFPVGIYAQRNKPSKEIVGVLGSSLTLHMAQVAPSVLATRHSFGDTIRDSINTLGKSWRQSLILKIGMYLAIFVVVVAPKLVQHQWFKSQTASNVGWLISLELAASSYVVFKVINSIFTTVLYHQATQSSYTRVLKSSK